MNPNLDHLVRGLADDGIPGVGVIVNGILQDADQCWVDNQAFGFTARQIYVMWKYTYFIDELALQSDLLSKMEDAWTDYSGML